MIKLKSIIEQVLIEDNTIGKNARNMLYNKWKKEDPNMNTDQMDYYINTFLQNRSSNVFKSKDIMSYKFSDLEHLIDANFSEKASGKFDISDKQSYQDDIVFENDELLIVSGNEKDKCIKYGRGESWCVSRSDINNRYYSYRMKYDYPAFYFVIDKTLPEDAGNKKLVVMVTNNNQYTIADRGNGNDVGFGKNHGGEEVSWEYISKIQPKIRNLQKLFIPIPPTDKEIEIYRKFQKPISIEEFKKLTFEELEYYLSIKNWLTKEQVEHILTLPRAKELIRRYAVTSIGKNLTQEIVNKYLSFSDKKQLANNIGWELNSDGTANIRGYYYITKNIITLSMLPFKIDTVFGNFECMSEVLVSLEGGPRYVRREFDCSYNLLTTLKGAPEYVDWNFHCYKNKLTTLEGAPEYVGGDFICHHNKLTSLEGAPKQVGRDFDCSENPSLTSLKGIPKKVGGNFYCKNIGKKFTEEEIRAICNVEKRVIV